MRRVHLLAIPSALCLAVACGFTLDFDRLEKGGPAAGAGGVPGAAGSAGVSSVPLDQLASALAVATCANFDACFGPALRVFIHDENCQTLFTNVIEEQTVTPIRQSVASGTVSYDPLRAAECVNKLVAGTRKSPPDCSQLNALIEGCKIALGNLAPAGQPCAQRFECQSGLLCRQDTGCPGTCSPFRQTGATCQQDAECDPTLGLYCQKSAGDAGTDAGATAGTCQPYVALNASCAAQDQCVPGALCIGSVCRRLTDVFTLAETLPCFNNGIMCNRGLACEWSGVPLLSAASCVAQKQPLAACKLALPGDCPPDYYCDTPNLLNATGQCVAEPIENQPCAAAAEQSVNPQISAPCHAGLTCVGGVCKPMRHLGEACEAAAQCYSGACRSSGDAGPAACVTPGCS
jgi:hypothetical protein